jgi:hypothetical protein
MATAANKTKIPPGGTLGQVLTKNSSTNFDYSWTSPAGAVSSVFGRTGAVVAQSGDYSTSLVTEGTNLYWTQARFDTAFAAKSTSGLAEGSNLYFTDARARTAVIASSIINGDLTHAPDGNSVFDALNSKVDLFAGDPNAIVFSGPSSDIQTEANFTWNGSAMNVPGTITATNLSGTNTGNQTAATVPNTPAGNIAATTVQAALNELDAEKVIGNTAITGSTKTKITYDAKGLVTSGADAAVADITGLQTLLDGKWSQAGDTIASGTKTIGNTNAGTAVIEARVNNFKWGKFSNTERLFYDTNGNNPVVDFNLLTLNQSDGTAKVLWSAGILNNSSGTPSVNWEDSTFYNPQSATVALDLNNLQFFDENSNTSLDFSSSGGEPRTLLDFASGPSIRWHNRELIDYAGVTALNYENGSSSARCMFDHNGFRSISWGESGRYLQASSGFTAHDWESGYIYDTTDGSYSAQFIQRYLYYPGTNSYAIDWGTGVWYSPSFEQRIVINDTGSDSYLAGDFGASLVSWRSDSGNMRLGFFGVAAVIQPSIVDAITGLETLGLFQTGGSNYYSMARFAGLSQYLIPFGTAATAFGSNSNFNFDFNNVRFTLGSAQGGNNIAKGNFVATSAADVVSRFVGTTSQSGDLSRWCNSANTTLSLVTSAGKFSIGTASAPTALLMLGAGTTAASTAPLKFNNGPLNTTSEAGSMEFRDEKYYLTPTTNASTRRFPIASDNNPLGMQVFS